MLFVSLVSGCASPYRTPVAPIDLMHFKPDCTKREEQMAFLTAVTPTRNEEQVAGMEMKIFGVWSTDYEYKRMLADGSMEYLVNQNIILLEQKCRN